MTRRGWWLLLALGAIWGMPYLLIRVAVLHVDPVVVAFARTLLGGLCLLPVAMRRNALAPLRKHWKALLAFTLVEISGPWWLLGHAETRVDSATAGVFIAVVPLLSALLSLMAGHERPDRARWLGLLLGFGGVAALIGLDVRPADPIALGALALTACGYAYGPLILARHLSGLPGVGVIAASLLLASLLYAPFVPFAWPQQPVPPQAVASIGALALLCTAVAFLLFFALIVEAGPSRATVVTYLNPVVAIVLGVLVLAEPLTLGMALGFPLIALGSVLGTRGARPKGAN